MMRESPASGNMRLQITIARLPGEIMRLRISHVLQGQFVQTQQELICTLEWRGASCERPDRRAPAYGELCGQHSSAYFDPVRVERLPPSPKARSNSLVVLAEMAEMHGSAETQGERDG